MCSKRRRGPSGNASSTMTAAANRDYDTALREGIRYLDQFAQAKTR